MQPLAGTTPRPCGSSPLCFTSSKDAPMKFRFPVIIIDEDFRSENISGSGIRALAQPSRRKAWRSWG